MLSNYLTVGLVTILLIQSMSAAPAPAPAPVPIPGIVPSLQPSIPPASLRHLLEAKPTPSFYVSNMPELRKREPAPTMEQPTRTQTVVPSIPASFPGQHGFAGFGHKPVPETKPYSCLPTPTWNCAPV